jgi:ABC-type branched-subunit amino acid transport system substrate-binding protein
MSNRTRLIFLAAGLTVSVVGSRAGAGNDEIVIGMSAAFSGSSRGLGIEAYRGSIAYFEAVNRSGGIHGRKIRIIAYDDGYDPIRAIENTVRLIEKDNALLLYGYFGTPTVTRVLPLLKEYEDHPAYLFFPFTGAEPHRRAPYEKYVFNLRASYARETAGLVDNFVRIGRKRIGVFYQSDAYGRSGWAGVRQALAKHGLHIAEEATYRRGTAFSASMREQVAILRSVNPDAVISVGTYAASAAFIRDARDENWNVPIANLSFVGSESLLSLLSELGEATGKDYTHDLINSQVIPSYHNRELPAVREYRDSMDTRHPSGPMGLTPEDYHPLKYSFVGFEAFLDAKLLTEILRRAGPDISGSRLAKAAESLNDFDLGIDVPVSFGPGRHQAMDTIYYTSVKDGRFLPLEGWR